MWAISRHTWEQCKVLLVWAAGKVDYKQWSLLQNIQSAVNVSHFCWFANALLVFLHNSRMPIRWEKDRAYFTFETSFRVDLWNLKKNRFTCFLSKSAKSLIRTVANAKKFENTVLSFPFKKFVLSLGRARAFLLSHATTCRTINFCSGCFAAKSLLRKQYQIKHSVCVHLFVLWTRATN